jgi:gliding motility-associated-like protein
MQKRIIFFIINCFIDSASAQQIKRQTLSSRGGVVNQAPNAPFRVSHTYGSCPGCNTLHAGANTPFLRQNFQQPPNTDESNNPPNCAVNAFFEFQETLGSLCGAYYDFQYAGGTTGVSYSWDFGVDAVPRFSQQANPTQIVYLTPGYKSVALRVQKDSCVKSSAHLIYVDPQRLGFGAQAQITTVQCFGMKNGTIRLAVSGGAGIKKFRWSTGDTTQDIQNLAAGRYKCTITDVNNCRFIMDTVVKQADRALAINAVVTNATCKDYRDGSLLLLLSGGITPYQVTWQTGDSGLKLDSLKGGQSYQVTIKDAAGCRFDTTLKVGLRCDSSSQRIANGIFDAITPNGDGKNDTWVVKDIESFPNNAVYIYNRWGNTMYYKKGYANEWAGTNQAGEPLAVGAYFYVIRLNDDNNTVYTGSVTVVR